MRVCVCVRGACVRVWVGGWVCKVRWVCLRRAAEGKTTGCVFVNMRICAYFIGACALLYHVRKWYFIGVCVSGIL